MTPDNTNSDQSVPDWVVPAAVLGGIVAAAAASAALVTAIVARSVVTPPKKLANDVRIVSVDRNEGTITLGATADTLLPGRYSLWFDVDGGHARIGEIVSVGGGVVTRTLLLVDFGAIELARTGRISGWYYLHPREFGFPFRDVSITTPLGDAPAWFIPAADAASTDWVIQVHGRAVRRAETLRAVPVFREAGFSSLLVSYRNDGDAPRSADGRFALGDSEWEDVDAAIQYAIDKGATRIVLMGWSMGGATVLQAATRSLFRDVIVGVVLDSPVIDWHETLLYRATEMHLPKQIGEAAVAAISQPWGQPVTGQKQSVDIKRLDFVNRSGELVLPTLLMHSDDDGFVSSVSSRELATLRPDIVTFVPFSIARHTKLWNYDPQKWTDAIASWLGRL
jgi:pimeloyl-ACP methyl ester carboxylesterase